MNGDADLDISTFKDMQFPHSHKPCIRCQRPGRYREPYKTLEGDNPRWLCEQCYKALKRVGTGTGEAIAILDYEGEDRIDKIRKTIRDGLKAGEAREAIWESVLYHNEHSFKPPFSAMELDNLFGDSYQAILEEQAGAHLADIEAIIQEGDGPKVYYKNDTRQGIIKVSERVTYRDGGKDVKQQVSYIFGYRMQSLERIENPADSTDIYYNVTFVNPKQLSRRLEYQEMTISQIANDITTTKAGVLKKQLLHEAISSIVQEYENREVVKVTSRIVGTGFFEDAEGCLQFHEGKDFKVNLPEHDKEKADQALSFLEDILEFYQYRDAVLTFLYFAIQSPLGYIRKLHGKENKMLLAHGESHTGKTYFGKIAGYFWGLPEHKSVINGSSITVPQLAAHYTASTLMITLDEVRNVISDPRIADTLKVCTTSPHARERIRPDQGYRREKFTAFASIAMTTNFVPSLYVGMQDRLIPAEYTPEMKRDLEAVERFEAEVLARRESLAYIGAALKDMFLSAWTDIKPIILSPDQRNAGRRLLELLYFSVGRTMPERMGEVSTTFEIETSDPLDVMYSYIKEGCLEQMQRYAKDLLHQDLSWEGRLIQMNRSGILPSYIISVTEKYIVLKPDIIQEIARKKGVEIPGGLKGMTYR
ncbi:MAG: hypothetical protein PHI12_13125, partial [Dehalococcoidales bacterium]|nr:hypothetical protein [Dehalococcoidales bacterium]